MVKCDLDSVQIEGAQHLRKLLSNEHNPPIQEVIDCGVLPALVQACAKEVTQLQFQAAWALTNVASGDSRHTRAAVQSGTATQFVALLSSPDDDVREQVVWGLGNIAGDSVEFR